MFSVQFIKWSGIQCRAMFRTGSAKAGSIPNQLGCANATKHRPGPPPPHTHTHTRTHTHIHTHRQTDKHTQEQADTHTNLTSGVFFRILSFVRKQGGIRFFSRLWRTHAYTVHSRTFYISLISISGL